ncbi:MAG: hypothetical protein Q9217_003547 [Psora testacea]
MTKAAPETRLRLAGYVVTLLSPPRDMALTRSLASQCLFSAFRSTALQLPHTKPLLRTWLPTLLPTLLPNPIATPAAPKLSIPLILAELWESILRAVPKKKTSHRKKRQRFMAGKGLQDVTALNRCSACGNVKRAHLLCPFCVGGQSQNRLSRGCAKSDVHSVEIRAMRNKEQRAVEGVEKAKMAVEAGV